MTTATKKPLAAKLAEVVLEVNNVEKDGHNDFQNYDYTSAEALLGAIRKPLASRNIVLIPKVSGVEERGITTPKGKPSTITTAHVSFTLIDADTGEREECRWAGTGDDPSDKGLYKAYTGAIKTFLRSTFLLPMGDDPEADTAADERTADGASTDAKDQPVERLVDVVTNLPGTTELATRDQLNKLGKAKEALGPTRFDAYLKAQGVDTAEDLTTEAAEAVLKWARTQAKNRKAA